MIGTCYLTTGMKEEALVENQEQLDKIAQFNSRQQKLFDL